jgi:hypothetical protein
MAAPLTRDPGYFLIVRRNQTPDERVLFARAVTYCLHLPRFVFDLCSAPVQAILGSLHFEPAHRIAFLRYPEVLAAEYRTELRAIFPTLLFASDDLLGEVQQLAQDVGAPLGAISITQLSPESLARHWKEMARLPVYSTVGQDPAGFNPLNAPPPTLEDLSPLAPMKLTIKFLARRIHAERLVGDLAGASEEDLLDCFLNLHRLLQALAAVEKDGDGGDFATTMDRHMRQPPRLPQVPLVLGSRSPRRRQFLWAGIGLKMIDPALDEPLYLAMLTHRTLASNGIGLRAADVPESLTQRLRQLEDLCAQPSRDIPKIWWTADMLGLEAAKVLGNMTSTVASILPSVVLFAEFPYGLALVDDASAPLLFISPVTYRPITPLAAAAEYEFELVPLVFLRTGFRVLLIECLDPNDPVYTAARAIWENLRRSMLGLPGLVFELAAAGSTVDLNAHLIRFAPDILIVSGHGGRDQNGQVAGIRVGSDLWVGDQIGFVPKVVILSACAVTPRSSEILNIADILLFQRVVAVIGTLVPVDFAKNANFLLRFFQSIHQAIIGNERFRSLDQAWCAALCGSAINDIIQNSEKLFAWSMLEWDRMMDDYIAQLNSGHIRPAHIYSDVERFLREYAAKRGVFKMFEEDLKPRSYFPETMFYVLIGQAQRIILQDDFSESVRRKSTDFDMLGNRRE